MIGIGLRRGYRPPCGSLPPCTHLAPGPAASSARALDRNKASPPFFFFLTLSDGLGFLLFVDLVLAFSHYLSLQKKNSALSISEPKLEGGVLPIGISK